MKSRLLKTVLATGLLIGSLAHAITIESDIGKGILHYDKEAGLKDRCIELRDADIYNEDTRLTTYTLDLVSNREELTDRIEIKGSGSGSYGVFSAKAKTKFVREIKWNFNSNYILVHATRISKTTNISAKNILLSDYSKNLLLDSKFKFLEACGSSYANMINLGGEIYGLIEIQAKTYQEKQEIEQKLSASGSFTGGRASGSGSYNRTIEKISSEYKIKVNFQHIGGEQIEVPNTVEGLLSLSNRIEQISDAHPVPLSIETRDYTTVSNYPLDNDTYEVRIRQDNITWAEGKLKTARNLYSQILYVLENQREFKNFDEAEMKNNLNYLDEKILELKAFIAKSYSFLQDSDTSKISLNLDIILPKRKLLSRRKPLNITCAPKASPICGVATYKNMKSSACGVVGVNEGTGPSCGTVYKEQASEFCGVKLYNLKAGSQCGVALYKQCHTRACGKNWDGSRKRCRNEACGVESYKSCRNEAFGVEAYNSCRNEHHEVEKYLTCKHKDFGYQFDSCQHLSHGPETFNTCDVTKIGSQETYCPEF